MRFEVISNKTLTTVLAVLGLSRWSHAEKMALLRSWHSEVAQAKGGL